MSYICFIIELLSFSIISDIHLCILLLNRLTYDLNDLLLTWLYVQMSECRSKAMYTNIIENSLYAAVFLMYVCDTAFIRNFCIIGAGRHIFEVLRKTDANHLFTFIFKP